MEEGLCPCGTGRDYKDCCAPIIGGERKAGTAEELMRSRYSAYAKAQIDHVINSTHPASRDSNDRDAIRQWAEKSEWSGFELLSSRDDGPDTTSIEFVANYSDHGKKVRHHELAEFRQSGGEWFFYDGNMVPQKPFVREAPKVGRNDPCTCGSGKKYKKCCGA